MALSNTELENKLLRLETQMTGLAAKIAKLQSDLEAKAYSSDLSRSESLVKNLILSNSKLITNLENRLSKVILPEETRFYLDQGEVSSFQSNFNKLRAMMADFESLYKSLVAYVSLNT